jgi:uncharacterized membrane protein
METFAVVVGISVSVIIWSLLALLGLNILFEKNGLAKTCLIGRRWNLSMLVRLSDAAFSLS